MSTPINRSYVILGASALVALVALLWLSGKVETIRRQDGQRYTVILDDGAGLPLGSPVRIAGVDVGRVESVEAVGGQAQLRVVLDPEVEVHTDASAGPRAKSLLGQKYLELRPGSEAAPRLPAGETIVDSWTSYEIDEALNALEPVFGEEGSLASTLTNFGELVARLRGAGPGQPSTEPAGEPAESTTDPADQSSTNATTEADELAAAIQDLREAAAETRALAERGRDELPTLVSDANAALSGRELDRTLTALDRVTASTARELPGLFDEGEQALRRAERALAEVEDFSRGLSPERVAKLDELLDDTATAAAEGRALTTTLRDGDGELGPLIDRLAEISRRATAIDELTIRKFLQQEGVLIRAGGGDREQATHRLEQLTPLED